MVIVCFNSGFIQDTLASTSFKGALSSRISKANSDNRDASSSFFNSQEKTLAKLILF